MYGDKVIEAEAMLGSGVGNCLTAALKDIIFLASLLCSRKLLEGAVWVVTL
jgi:hypothetical protein